MPEKLLSLRDLFLSKYAAFRHRLQARLGSEDLANDALHEAWLRVDAMSETADVKHPAAYLFRIAVNAAEDQRRSDSRLMAVDEIDALYDSVADESADPARVVLGRVELERLERALSEMPPRRRAILLAARLDEVPHREIAQRFGISLRTVEKELRAGLEHCCTRLEKKYVQRFGPGAGKTS